MNIYVGNLSFSTTEEGLRGLFEQSGPVDTVTIIQDRVTGRSRGFGFVEMPDDSNAQAAIAALDGNDFDGRNLKVNQAKEREDRGSRGGGGGYSGGGRRDSGGYGGGGGGYDSNRSGGNEGNAVSPEEGTNKSDDSGFGSGLDDD
ncbi:MAG: RNA-binding protein [Sedimentisphaerales bacterium]|nr:RNA-binding protein [Sedimentisphaerales bacterium]